MGVGFDDLELRIVELAGLVEHLVRYADLAYIVHKRDVVVVLDRLLVVAKLAREHGGVLRHAGRMTLRVAVLKIDDLSERLDYLADELLIALLALLVNVHLVGSVVINGDPRAEENEKREEHDTDHGNSNNKAVSDVAQDLHRNVGSRVADATARGIVHRLVDSQKPAVSVV